MARNTDHVKSSPVFAPLRVHGAAALDKPMPELDDFRRLLDQRKPAVRVASGRALRIVAQGGKPVSLEQKYEARLYLEGELQVRRGDWHDCFNVLAWLAYPRAKAALNARHHDALQAQHAAGTPNRGPEQDALTLFDESGIVMVSADGDLLQMVRDFRWKELFWKNRGRLEARARCFLFGHALYEKMLRPFRGITGRGVLLDADPALLAMSPGEQLDVIDAQVAACLSDPARFVSTRELAVLPLLGVPGWHAGNEAEAFYDDADYFRPGRLREVESRKAKGES
jgi:hypothetical protein